MIAKINQKRFSSVGTAAKCCNVSMKLKANTGGVAFYWCRKCGSSGIQNRFTGAWQFETPEAIKDGKNRNPRR